jgi:hypothetical protein
MLSGWRSKALWVAALLPLLAASVLPTQIRTLVCRFTGAIMQEEVCCPSALDEKAPPAAQLIGEGCCVVKTVDLTKLVSENSTDGLPPVQTLALAVAQPVATLVFPRRWTPSLPVRPPPRGASILLVKRSFLI